MLEHLDSSEFDDLDKCTSRQVLEAQANTADFLLQMGSPEYLLDEDDRDRARQAFSAVTDPNVSDKKAVAALTRLNVPEAVKHLSCMLTQYDWNYVEQASQIRSYVVAKLMEECENKDPRIRIAALKALGSVTEVGAFTERIEITKKDATTDELQERLRAKLAALLPKVVEVQDISSREEGV